MEVNLQQQYERVLLLVFGLIAVAACGFLVFKSVTAEDDSAKSFAEGDKIDEAGVSKVDKAIKLIEDGSTWEDVTRESKPVSLMVSTPLLKKGDKVFDMQDRETPPLHPPVDNWWWYEHKIDPTDDTCLESDEDGDGFTNVAEFENGTDPNDPESKPDWPTAVYLAERIEQPYSFKLTYIGPEIQFTRVEPGRRVWFLKAGTKEDTTKDDDEELLKNRFKLVGVTPPGDDPFTEPAKVELIDNWRDDGNPLTLETRRDPHVRPSYKASIGFSITGETVEVIEGGTIEFTGLPVLTLEDLTAEEATLSYEEDGKKQTFRAKLQQ